MCQPLANIPSSSIIGCGEDQILLIDPKIQDDSEIVFWRWTVEESQNDLPHGYAIQNIDECKPIDGNTKILFTAGGASGILDVRTKNIEFYARTFNAHSADTLPGGYIAIANSLNPKGNSLVLYHRSASDVALWRDTLYYGHGVVWNNATEKLYALGYDQIVEYSFIDDSDAPYLRKEKTYMMPDNGGHDLSRVNDNSMLVTTLDNVYRFDIEEEKFTKFKRMKDVGDVKTVNYNPLSGRLVYTKGEESWWTSNIYTENPHRVLFIPDFRLYKARLVE